MWRLSRVFFSLALSSFPLLVGCWRFQDKVNFFVVVSRLSGIGFPIQVLHYQRNVGIEICIGLAYGAPGGETR